MASLQQAAQLDALASLALAAELACAHGPVCRPRILSDDGAQPVRNGQHLWGWQLMRAPLSLPLCLLRCRALLLVSCVMHALQAFRAAALRHPAASVAFVPNDIQLGGGRAPFMLLTGANMGGKSTLLRQVALLSLLQLW